MKRKTEPFHFCDYHIREDMVEVLERYLNDGVPPGGFLRAVLSNDLMAACQRADQGNLANLPAYAAYIYQRFPILAHGSPEAVDHWIERGGKNGYPSR